MKSTRILVGFDHSDRSDRALGRAREIVREHGGQVVVAAAVDVSPHSSMRALLEKVVPEETRERAARILGLPEASIEVHARAGRAHEIIRDIARDLKVGLIVLGVHRTDDGPFNLVGSTARRLINAAPAPVLIVKNDPNGPYRNVLVGYDDSAAARAAIQFANELTPQGRRTIVAAFRVPFFDRVQSEGLTAQAEAQTREMLGEAFGKHGVRTDDSIVRPGDAYTVIMEAVRERNPDLLVLGTSMPALYRQVFGGGIVDLVATHPPCDLLVVKA